MRRALSYFARDLVFLAVLCLVCGSAAAGVGWCHRVVVGAIPAPWSWALLPLYLPLFAFAMIPGLVVLRVAAGPLVPGRYPLRGGGRPVRAWMVHFGLARIVYNPLWHRMIFSLATLRWATLRALGCRAALDFESSSDIVVLEAALHRIEAGSMLAAQVKIAGHVVQDGYLRLAPVHVGRGAQVMLGTRLGPGTELGEAVVIGPLCQLAGRTRIGARTRLGPSVHLGEGGGLGADVQIGEDARVGLRARIGDRAEIGSGVRLGVAATVEDDARIDDGARIGTRARIGAGARVGRLAVLGAGVRVEAGAEVGEGAWLGAGVVVRAGERVAAGARVEAAPAADAADDAGASA